MKNNIFKLSYKIIALIIVTGFLIWPYVLGMTDKVWTGGGNNTNNIPFEYGEFTLFFLSFFTTQSNIVVAVFFLLAIIFHKKEESVRLTGQTAKRFMAGYISVTATIWVTVLFPLSLQQGTLTTVGWILSVEPHVIAPALAIIYAIWNGGLQKVEWKQYFKKEIWIYIIYPLIYIVYIMIRGEMRWADGKGGLSYPYPFLNVHQTEFGMPGGVTFVIFFFLILVLFFGYNILYVAINNLKFKKQQKQNIQQ